MSQTQEEELVNLTKPMTKVFVKNFKDHLEAGKGSFTLALTAYSQEGAQIGSLVVQPRAYWQNAVAQNTLQTLAGPICLAVDSADAQAVSDLIDLSENLDRHTKRVIHANNTVARKLIQEREFREAETKLAKRKGTLAMLFVEFVRLYIYFVTNDRVVNLLTIALFCFSARNSKRTR
jgi:hypothetical protein